MAGLPATLMTKGGTSPITVISPISQWSAPMNFAPSWNCGIVCTSTLTSTGTYTVQVTCDQQPSAGGNWNSHDTLVNQTGSANGNIAYPVTGVRLNVPSSVYVSGSVNMGIALWP
jgi:hypothetical protein